MELRIYTEQLQNECQDALDRFWEMRRLNREPDFFNEVKPHADQLHAAIKNWQQLAHLWIKENHPKNLYVQQIDHAADAMEQFVVQSFYKGTSKKRFTQSIQSVQYTLSIVVKKLEDGDMDVK